MILSGKKWILAGFFLAAVLLVTMPAGAGAMTREEIENHLLRGEEAFRQGLAADRRDPESAREYFQHSLMRFELVTQEGGVRNGRLFYNIGNVYFRLGDIGRAILNYRRAALYIPNDQNLKQNLEYARSRRLDRIERKQGEKVLGTIFFFHYDIPSYARLWIFTLSFGLTWILATLLLLLRRESLKIAAWISGALCFVFLVSLSAETINISRKPAGVIIAEEVIARKGDAETYQPSFTEPLHAGAEFVQIERRADWMHIELEDGVRTWIPARAGELLME